MSKFQPQITLHIKIEVDLNLNEKKNQEKPTPDNSDVIIELPDKDFRAAIMKIFK